MCDTGPSADVRLGRDRQSGLGCRRGAFRTRGGRDWHWLSCRWSSSAWSGPAVLGGMDVVEVAARAGVHRSTVHRWVARYLGEDRWVVGPVASSVVVSLAGGGGGRGGGGGDASGPSAVGTADPVGVLPASGAMRRLRCLRAHDRPDPARRGRCANVPETPRSRGSDSGPGRCSCGHRHRGWHRPGRRTPGRSAKIVTGVDDHSRFCVMAAVVERATTRAVCSAFAQALAHYGPPEEVITDNAKQFTDRFGRYGASRGEVLRQDLPPQRHHASAHTAGIAEPEREGGAVPRHLRPDSSPTPTRSSSARLRRPQDGWVADYNAERPHQGLDPPGRWCPQTGSGPRPRLGGSCGCHRPSTSSTVPQPLSPTRWCVCCRWGRSSSTGRCRRRGTWRCAATSSGWGRHGPAGRAVLDRLRLGAPVDRWAADQVLAVAVQRQRLDTLIAQGAVPAAAAGAAARPDPGRSHDRGGRAHRGPQRDRVQDSARCSPRKSSPGVGWGSTSKRAARCCSSTSRPELLRTRPNPVEPGRPPGCNAAVRSDQCRGPRPNRSPQRASNTGVIMVAGQKIALAVNTAPHSSCTCPTRPSHRPAGHR